MNSDGIIMERHATLEAPEVKTMILRHEAENEARAMQREEELLNRPTPVFDALIYGIEMLQKLYTRQCGRFRGNCR